MFIRKYDINSNNSKKNTSKKQKAKQKGEAKSWVSICRRNTLKVKELRAK